MSAVCAPMRARTHTHACPCARFHSRLFITCTVHTDTHMEKESEWGRERERQKGPTEIYRKRISHTGLILAWNISVTQFHQILIIFSENYMYMPKMFENVCRACWRVRASRFTPYNCTINGPNFDLDFPQCDINKFPQKKLKNKQQQRRRRRRQPHLHTHRMNGEGQRRKKILAFQMMMIWQNKALICL